MLENKTIKLQILSKLALVSATLLTKISENDKSSVLITYDLIILFFIFLPHIIAIIIDESRCDANNIIAIFLLKLTFAIDKTNAGPAFTQYISIKFAVFILIIFLL